MKEKEFWDCKFIDNGLKFYTKYEVLKDIKIIKKIYNQLSANERYMYRWYVYAHPNLDYRFKNLLWDVLNEYKEIKELYK